MIRAIAFDWGGIFTVGTFDSSAIRNLAALANAPVEAVAPTYLALMAELETGAFPFDEFHERFVARTGLRVDAGPFRKTFLGSVRERPEAFALLASLPDDLTVGMLSNNVEVLCDRVRDDPRMARIPRERFVFSNEIGVRKPDPAAFAALTRALGVPPEETAFVDDSPANVEASRALGYHGLLLDTPEGFARRWRALLPELPLPEGLGRD